MNDPVKVAEECEIYDNITTEPRTRVEQLLARASGVMNHLVSVILDLEVDGHYISKDEQKEAAVSIVGDSTKTVGVANQGSSKGKLKIVRSSSSFD